MPSDFGSVEQLVQKYHKWKTRLLWWGDAVCIEKPISELKINAVKQILLLLVSTNRPQQIEWKQLEKTNYSPLLWTTYVEFTYECDNDVYVHSTTNTTTISNHWAHPSTGQTKCNKSTFQIQQRQLRSMAPFVAASQLKADETMILLGTIIIKKHGTLLIIVCDLWSHFRNISLCKPKLNVTKVQSKILNDFYKISW